MSSCRYRRAERWERQRLVEFLAEHWRADHLFVQDPAWFDWQHLASDGQTYHAIVAIGDEVEMTFRRLFTADGVHNYFWKARPVRKATK